VGLLSTFVVEYTYAHMGICISYACIFVLSTKKIFKFQNLKSLHIEKHQFDWYN